MAILYMRISPSFGQNSVKFKNNQMRPSLIDSIINVHGGNRANLTLSPTFLNI